MSQLNRVLQTLLPPRQLTTLKQLLQMKVRYILLCSIIFSIGLGFGSMASFIMLMKDKPSIIIRDRWRTIETKPPPPLVPHTSLNEDEIETILRLQSQPDNVYINPKAPPESQIRPSTTTTVPKTTTTVASTTITVPKTTTTVASTTTTVTVP